MTHTSPKFDKTIAGILLSGAVLLGTAKAQIVSHSKDIIIEQPVSLPELAQQPGVAFQLYTESGDGSAYLYIEQHNGERLVVLDVTNPARVKMVRNVTLSVPGAFDFVQPLRTSAVLVRFRNNLGEAVLDLHKARTPVLRTISGEQFSGRTEPLGNSAFLMVDEVRMEGHAAPRNYQVVDTSNPANPAVLYTAKLVNCTLTRKETGTTFLLGSDGLTIIRQPQVEQEYQLAQRASY